VVLAPISVDVGDLVESLYGAADHPALVQRNVTWCMWSAVRARMSAAPAAPPDLDRIKAPYERWHQITVAMNAVLRACASGTSTKTGEARRYVYGSTTFRRSLVYGMGIFPKPGVERPRLRAVQGDQNDSGLLNKIGRQPGPFDIIIDDGSHVNEHVKTSFRSLFPYVRPGGLYVVEDLQTAYWPGYGGNDTDLVTADTSMGMLKALVDGLNYTELPADGRTRRRTPTGMWWVCTSITTSPWWRRASTPRTACRS